MAIEDVEIVGKLSLSAEGTIILEVVSDESPGKPSEVKYLHIADSGYDLPGLYAAQSREPTQFPLSMPIWAFRNFVLQAHPAAEASLGRDRVVTLVKHRVIPEERRWKRIEREVEAFEDLDRLSGARRG